MFRGVKISRLVSKWGKRILLGKLIPGGSGALSASTGTDPLICDLFHLSSLSLYFPHQCLVPSRFSGFVSAHFQQGFGVFVRVNSHYFPLTAFFLKFLLFVLSIQALLRFLRQARTPLFAAVSSNAN